MTGRLREQLRIVAISDTHGLHRRLDLPEGDLLLHAGDIARSGSQAELVDFNDWLGELPYLHKVVIAGNHDSLFERDPGRARSCLTNAVYLQDSEIIIGGWKIYGSPWQPEFFNWSFNLPRGKALEDVWAKIPDDTDILVTHGPPAGILDGNLRGIGVGCEALATRLRTIRPKLHVFGHIHEAVGAENFDGTHFVNASVVDIRYALTHPATVIDLS